MTSSAPAQACISAAPSPDSSRTGAAPPSSDRILRAISRPTASSLPYSLPTPMTRARPAASLRAPGAPFTRSVLPLDVEVEEVCGARDAGVVIAHGLLAAPL